MRRHRLTYSELMRVLVLGAGIIGSAVADALARRGAEVVVLDMRGPGRGATHASAGVLAPFVEAGRDQPMLDLCSRSLEMFDEFVAAASERGRRAVEFRRCGTIQIALDDARRTALEHELQQLRRRGVEASWLDASALRDAEPTATPHALGGLLIHRHAYVRVPELMAALVNSARQAGATFESPVEAAAVRAGANSVDVRAGERSYSADRVVIATGSWSTRVRVRDEVMPTIRPVRGQLLELGWPENGPRLPQRVVWGPDCYTVPWSDGGVLVGATVEDVGFDESATVEGVRALSTAVETLLPAARGAALRSVRVGLRPSSADGRPIIGPFVRTPNVILATGHFRNGILLAPITAQILSRLVIDDERDPALAVTSPTRPPKEHPDETVAR